MAGVDYRYELRRGDEVVATGHLTREQPLQIGDRIEIGGQAGIVRTIEPLLGERELRLVVQLHGVVANAPSRSSGREAPAR